MKKQDTSASVIYNKQIADGIFELKLALGVPVAGIKGGQFLAIALNDGAKCLRRPFGVSDFDPQENTVTVMYLVVGGGTRALAEAKAGDTLNVLLPLGNGFLNTDGKKVMLVGGGMGGVVFPAVVRAAPNAKYYAFLGFQTKKRAILAENLRAQGAEVFVATDDGTLGAKGFVTAHAREQYDKIKPDFVFCCGPVGMYRALGKAFAGTGANIFVSLEERMGCGVGACVVCVCKINTAGGAKFKRVCADGPVFRLEDVADVQL